VPSGPWTSEQSTCDRCNFQLLSGCCCQLSAHIRRLASSLEFRLLQSQPTQQFKFQAKEPIQDILGAEAKIACMASGSDLVRPCFRLRSMWVGVFTAWAGWT